MLKGFVVFRTPFADYETVTPVKLYVVSLYFSNYQNIVSHGEILCDRCVYFSNSCAATECFKIFASTYDNSI